MPGPGQNTQRHRPKRPSKAGQNPVKSFTGLLQECAYFPYAPSLLSRITLGSSTSTVCHAICGICIPNVPSRGQIRNRARIHVRQLLEEHLLQAPFQANHRLRRMQMAMNRHPRARLNGCFKPLECKKRPDRLGVYSSLGSSTISASAHN